MDSTARWTGQVGENAPAIDFGVLLGDSLEGRQAAICLVRSEGVPAVRLFPATRSKQNLLTFRVHRGIRYIETARALRVSERFVE